MGTPGVRVTPTPQEALVSWFAATLGILWLKDARELEGAVRFADFASLVKAGSDADIEAYLFGDEASVLESSESTLAAITDTLDKDLSTVATRCVAAETWRLFVDECRDRLGLDTHEYLSHELIEREVAEIEQWANDCGPDEPHEATVAMLKGVVGRSVAAEWRKLTR